MNIYYTKFGWGLLIPILCLLLLGLGPACGKSERPLTVPPRPALETASPPAREEAESAHGPEVSQPETGPFVRTEEAISGLTGTGRPAAEPRTSTLPTTRSIGCSTPAMKRRSGRTRSATGSQSYVPPSTTRSPQAGRSASSWCCPL